VEVGTVAQNNAFQLYAGIKGKLWTGLRTLRAQKSSARCLRRLFPAHGEISEESVKKYVEELSHVEAIRESIEQYSDVIGKNWEQKVSGRSFSSILFCFIALRLKKPEIVIETGCATGWTSALILCALHLNGRGHLYSIDIPPVSGELSMDWTLPAHLSAGFLVPDLLRDRWTLIAGNVREHLIPLLKEQNEIDVFFHDSDHTYCHMMWEYTSVWPYLKRGGILISDDIGWNTAFWDFATAVKSPAVIHRSNPNVGTLLKSLP